MANTNLGLLKPLRQYREEDVLQFQSLHNLTGAAGSFVTFLNSGINIDLASASIYANLGAQLPVNNAYSPQYFIRNKVKLATSGEFPFGMLLYDQLGSNVWGANYRYNPTLKAERQATVSGDSVPVVQRGYFLVNIGTGAQATGATTFLQVSDTVAGGYKVVTTATNSAAELLGPPDSDGYALIYLNCHKV